MTQILGPLFVLLIAAAGFAVMLGLWSRTKGFFFKAGGFLLALMVLPGVLLGAASGAMAHLSGAVPGALPLHLPFAEIAAAYAAWLVGLGTCFGAARAVEASE